MSDKAEEFDDLFPDDEPLEDQAGGGGGNGDDGGDAGADAVSGQDAASGDGDGQGDAEADIDGHGDPQGGKVPLGALKAVREEKKGLAAKVETLEAQLAAVLAGSAPAPVAPAPAPAPVPTISQVIGQLDPLDPEYSVKLGQVIEDQTRKIETQTRLRVSREAAVREFGADEVNAAFEYFNKHPAQSQALLGDASPFHAAVAVYRKQQALSEIGDDPAAFVEKTRQRVLAELQAAHSGQAAAPQVVTTRPNGGPSLAGQPNLGSRSAPEWSGPETLDEILGG